MNGQVVSTIFANGHDLVVGVCVLYLGGELISSVKMSSVKALAMARSSRVSNWAKVSPCRRTSMARQLSSSLATATQPTGRTTPMVISTVVDQLGDIGQG